jgi:hypothetical protein
MSLLRKIKMHEMLNFIVFLGPGNVREHSMVFWRNLGSARLSILWILLAK